MLPISESVNKRGQAATERIETPKKVKLERGKPTPATHESSTQRKTRSKHHPLKALCFFLAYEEPTKNDGFIPTDLYRLLSAEDKYGYDAHTITKKETADSLRHLTGNITSGKNLCFEIVRKWKDINFDMIAFDWYNMPSVYYRERVPSTEVFEFLLGTPGFLYSGGIVDIPCTPQYYERHLAVKGSLDELFDITYLHEHELAEKCFLSEGNGEMQHTMHCRLTRKLLEQLEAYSCDTDNVLRVYDSMIKDHGGNEDICMIRSIVKQNLEALPPTESLRPHEEVHDEKKKGDDYKICWEGPKTRNEGRLPFDAQARPASVAEKKPRPEEIDPTIDPSSSTTAGKQKKSSSSVAAAVTTAAPAPTGILPANENDSEIGGGGGISGTAAPDGITEAAGAQSGSCNTGMQVQVVAKKKTKQEKLKSAKGKSKGELISSLLNLDIETGEADLNALLEKELWRSSRKEVRDEILSHGGCLAGIQALRAHLESWPIQRKACQLLIALSHERKDIKRIILNLGGLVAIVNAMKANIGRVDLQHAACNALNHLGIWESDSDKLIHAKVIDTLIEVANAHVTDVYICQYVCCILELLGAKSADLAQEIVAKDGPELALLVFKKHSNHKELKVATRSLVTSLMKG